MSWKKFLAPENIAVFFLKLFLLTFPLQIQTLLYKTDLFNGQFNFFAAYFLGISEVFLLSALFFWSLAKFFGKSESSFSGLAPTSVDLIFFGGLVAMVIWNLLSVFWAADKTIALLYGFRWLELLGVLWILSSGLMQRDTILKYLFLGASFQVVIAVGQYLKQADLGLQFLGEPHLGADYLNIAKINLAGEKILRGYGTFAHANLLGGYLFVCLGLLIQGFRKENVYAKLPFLMIFLIGLIISFSRTAWLAAAVFALMIFLVGALKVNWKQILLAVVLLLFILVVFGLDQVILARIVDFSGQAWQERLLFGDIASQMIWANPWLGIGAGNFVSTMDLFYSSALSPWLYQPAHNVFMMIVGETGFIGLMFWLVILYGAVRMVFESFRRLINNQRYSGRIYFALLMGVLVLGLLDHYLYTIWAGQVLIFLLLSLILLDYRQHRKDLLE